jgi:DNA-binding IclR family transcriptional regulator
MAVRDGNRSVNVQVIEGRGMLRISGALGQGFPLHASAPGKIFLAFEPSLLERVSRHPLPALTRTTITTTTSLRQEIKRIRQQGLALNREELARGLTGIAAPVFDHAATCVAAMGILVPVSTCRAQALTERFGTGLLSATAEISHALGYRGK